MYNTDFSNDQPAEKKAHLSYEVEMLSKPSAMAEKGEYELVSRQRSIISRAILGELSEESEFSIYLYGYMGRSMNLGLRDPFNNTGFFKADKKPEALRLIKLFRDKYDLVEKDSIYFRNKAETTNMKRDLQEGYRGATSRAFRFILDETIENYSPRFSKSGYLYRSLRVEKNAYTPPSEISDPKLQKIVPGDIIMDESVTSSATRAEVVIYRYTSKGQSASLHKPMLDTEEEVLFMIENTDKLKAIDISGYKFPKYKDDKTSGEMLIKSRSKFKVIGIQKSDPRLDRRIVLLEPISEDMVKPTDPIKNPYNGEIDIPATATGAATVATGSAISGAVGGAIGGATGSDIPKMI